MLTYKNENKVIYKIKEEEGKKIKEIVGNKKRIKINNVAVYINTIIDIPIAYQKFDIEQGKYITDTAINKTIELIIDEVKGLNLKVINGLANIDFESAQVGKFEIKIENVICEVVVND